MSRQADQAHWCQRRQQMLDDWNHGERHDLDSCETIVTPKRPTRTASVPQKIAIDHLDHKEWVARETLSSNHSNPQKRLPA